MAEKTLCLPWPPLVKRFAVQRRLRVQLGANQSLIGDVLSLGIEIRVCGITCLNALMVK